MLVARGFSSSVHNGYGLSNAVLCSFASFLGVQSRRDVLTPVIVNGIVGLPKSDLGLSWPNPGLT